MATRLALPARREDDSRSQTTIKVDFFKVQDEGIGTVEFRNALRGAMRLRGANRSKDVFGERVDLYTCHESDSIIEGEIGRVRMNDMPAVAKRDCSLSEIPLEDEEGIAERTAFLYDSNLSVLALHTKREAVSASRIAGFCDRFTGNNIDRFVLQPILKADADRRFRSMTAVKKIEVEYSRGASTAIHNPDPSTRSFVENLSSLNGETLTVTVSSGRKKENRLSFDRAIGLVRSALTGRNEVVQKLTISGRGAGDEALVVDLIEDRLRVPVTLKFRGRIPSYEQRRAAVRRAYEANLPLLQ